MAASSISFSPFFSTAKPVVLNDNPLGNELAQDPGTGTTPTQIPEGGTQTPAGGLAGGAMPGQIATSLPSSSGLGGTPSLWADRLGDYALDGPKRRLAI